MQGDAKGRNGLLTRWEVFSVGKSDRLDRLITGNNDLVVRFNLKVVGG